MSIYTYLMYIYIYIQCIWLSQDFSSHDFHRISQGIIFFGEPCSCYFWSLHVSTSKFSDTGCHRRFAKGLSQSWKWTGHERLKLRKLEAWPPVAIANWRQLMQSGEDEAMKINDIGKTDKVTDGHGSRMVMVVLCEIVRILEFVEKIMQVFSGRKM